MKIISALLSMMIASSAMAGVNNHPDSVYVKACAPDNPKGGISISYSTDKKTWVSVGNGYGVVRSDFGTWGAQKNMYSPTVEYRDGMFYAEWLLGNDIPQYATTQSADLFLWKPQDYPYLSAEAFAKKKAELQGKSENIMRVPWSVIDNLITKVKANQSRYASEGESLAADERKWKNRDGVITLKDAGNGLHLTADLNSSKAISPELFGIFFEDINYSADGGLYAELIQNRDFEYSSKDRREWNAKTSWTLEGEGTEWIVSDAKPLHKNNSHYTVLKTSNEGARLVNEGFDGIVVKKGEKYNLSMFVNTPDAAGRKMVVSLVDGNKTLASATVSVSSSEWKQIKLTLTASDAADKAKFVIQPLQAGEIAIDFVSLMPQKTYKSHGLRVDLAQTLADIKPQFVRFPGGCATHGNGINNIYHWQSTIGNPWEREGDFNIWGYHQSRGLGFYEYFQFCEDIGATPLPVLAAGVPCQNSSNGGHGQQGGIPWEKDMQGKTPVYYYQGKPLTMESYLQELLDLIEWANGDAKTSALARKRAEAGHPKPFGMKYLGIGNEDLISDVFLERYNWLIKKIGEAHPEITLVGTVGPFWEGSDYEYGWQDAKKENIAIVDEHYYNPEGWYLNNQDFYDRYDRNGTKVYLGEWASKGNRLSNALVEAIHICNVERNADVVVMSSYAPLLAKEGHTQWNPDLIYFNNTEVKPTPNYWVQALSGQNAGDEYVFSSVKGKLPADAMSRVASSIVKDKETGDVIIKLVNALPIDVNMNINLGDISGYKPVAKKSVVAGHHSDRDVQPQLDADIQVSNTFDYMMPKYSFTVIRIKKK